MTQYSIASQFAGTLAGRVALATGGDSGIGAAYALAFAATGADVAITGLHEDDGARGVADQIRATGAARWRSAAMRATRPRWRRCSTRSSAN